ncbi:putative quinone-oxidoreductase, chloroplastic [Naviculisporaceae sp. PSN 640]
MSSSEEEHPPPKTIKAWTYTKGGLPHQALKLTTDHPLPEFPPKTNPSTVNEEWLLVRVKYAALNPGDVLVMDLLPTILSATFSSSAGVPQVLGYDLTGEVIDVSPSTTSSENENQGPEGGFKKGSKIIAFLPISFLLSSKSGAFQEIIAIPSKYAVLLPPCPTTSKDDTHTDRLKEAAGLLLTGCTALAQIRNANLQPGQKVLVYGASGGIGTMAVQLARVAVGSEGKVIGVCSTRNLKAVWELGCDEVVDYTNPSNVYTGSEEIPTSEAQAAGSEPDSKEAIETYLARTHGSTGDLQREQPKFDAVIDCYGSQSLFNHSSAYLKETGIYSACGVHANGYDFGPVLFSGLKILMNNLWPRTKWLGGTGRTWIAASMFDPGREMMEYLMGLFGEGKLRVLRDGDRIWDFEDLPWAYEVLISGRARGKVVVRVAEGE